MQNLFVQPDMGNIIVVMADPDELGMGDIVAVMADPDELGVVKYFAFRKG